MLFKKTLLDLMEKTQTTKYRLAKILGTSESTIANWLNEAATPKMESIIRMAEYFNVSTDYLLFGTNKPSYVEKKQEAVSLVKELTPEEVKKLLEYKDILISQRNKK